MTVLCNTNDFVQALVKLQREKHAAQITSPPSLQSADDIVDAARSLGMSEECCTSGLLSHQFKVYFIYNNTVETIIIL